MRRARYSREKWQRRGKEERNRGPDPDNIVTIENQRSENAGQPFDCRRLHGFNWQALSIDLVAIFSRVPAGWRFTSWTTRRDFSTSSVDECAARTSEPEDVGFRLGQDQSDREMETSLLFTLGL